MIFEETINILGSYKVFCYALLNPSSIGGKAASIGAPMRRRTVGHYCCDSRFATLNQRLLHACGHIPFFRTRYRTYAVPLTGRYGMRATIYNVSI